MSKTDNVFNGSKIPNFEDVVAKTKSVAENLNKKSAQCLEFSRKRVEYLDAKTKLAKCNEKFGNLQFEMLLGNQVDEAERDTLIAEITAYRSRIDVLKNELEDTKSIKDTEDLKKGAQDLKNEVISASKEAIEILKQRAKEATIAVQNAVDKANSDKYSDDVEIEIEPEAVNGESIKNTEE